MNKVLKLITILFCCITLNSQVIAQLNDEPREIKIVNVPSNYNKIKLLKDLVSLGLKGNDLKSISGMKDIMKSLNYKEGSFYISATEMQVNQLIKLTDGKIKLAGPEMCCIEMTTTDKNEENSQEEQ